MTGLTPKLDQMVQRAAEALRDLFGRDVEIRFNSDRMSGGAFLKGEEDGRKLGICVRLEPRGLRRPKDMMFPEWKRLYDAAPKLPSVYVNAGRDRLVDKTLARDGAALRHPYAYLRQRSIPGAVRWVRDNTLRLDGDASLPGIDR